MKIYHVDSMYSIFLNRYDPPGNLSGRISFPVCILIGVGITIAYSADFYIVDDQGRILHYALLRNFVDEFKLVFSTYTVS